MAQNFVTSAVRAFIEKEFGGPTTEQESNVVVPAGLGLIRLVANNAERVSLTFVNVSANVVNIGFGGVLLVGGFELLPNGGTINMQIRDDASLPAHEWYGNSGPGGTVYILEVIRSIYTPSIELPGLQQT